MPRRLRRTASQLVCLLLLAAPAAAQLPGIQRQPPAAPAPAADPLGRSSPRGSLRGFIVAMERDDLASAARFLGATDAQRRDIEALARNLRELLDRYLSRPITSISDAPAGSADDGLPFDRERVGPLTIGGEAVDVILVRVNDPEGGPIWLVSSETLARVPELHRLLEVSWVERVMPAALQRHRLFALSYAQWLVLTASVGLPLGLLWLLSQLGAALASRTPARFGWLVALQRGARRVRWPVIVVLSLATSLALLPFIGLPVSFRFTYARLATAVFVVAMAWLVRRLSASVFERARTMMDEREHANAESLLLLGERFVDVLIVLVALFTVLTVVGVDTTTALAGVGIGGIAIALGAQKTVENLLGGVFLLADNALAVGDLCSISGRLGRVEDITLRSIRLRTTEQSMLSIPAGTLSQASIENFATRRKILIQTIVRLRYGTTVEQMKAVLEGVTAMLAGDARVEPETVRVRLVEFGKLAIEIEVFAYVLTADVPTFFATREEILLRVASIVADSGTAFAQPADLMDGGPAGPRN